MSPSLVTVIVPTYNRTTRLENCITSIVNQIYRPLEVIVVNDGNVNVEKLIREKYDREIDGLKIKVINNEFNLGACHTRNRGIDKATGEFLTLCDDDDSFTNSRIFELVELIKGTHAKAVFSDTINKFEDKDKITSLPKRVTTSHLMKGNVIGAQLLTYTKIAKNIKFDNKFVASQDHDFNYRLVKECGEAIKHRNASYISNQYDSDIRVSNSRLIGRLQFYVKHKNDFSYIDKFIFHLKFIVHYVK